MEKEKYYEVNGMLQQIEDINTIIREVHAFKNKFTRPIDLCVFYHVPHPTQMEIKNTCDKLIKEFESLIQIEEDKIKEI